MYFIIMFYLLGLPPWSDYTDLYIDTPDFNTHLRKRTILWLAHFLADVELYEQYDP